jgi:hypothetical protein
VISLRSQSDLAFVLLLRCFFGVFVITNTSDILGARISDPCTDRRWWIFSCQFFHHGIESVDLFSIDEAYESIGAGMLDHNRCRSRAHLFHRVPMNTRRRSREV